MIKCAISSKSHTAPKEKCIAPKNKSIAPKNKRIAPKNKRIAPKNKPIASKNKAKIAHRALDVYTVFSRRDLHQNASKSIFLEIYGLRMDLGWVLCIFEESSGVCRIDAPLKKYKNAYGFV